MKIVVAGGGVTVTGLTAAAGQPPHVTGVRTSHGEIAAALAG